MLNVSGHLLSTAEVESALAEHEAVAEAAAVSFPHEIKGQAIFCYVVLKEGRVYDETVEQDLKNIGEYYLHRSCPNDPNSITMPANQSNSSNWHKLNSPKKNRSIGLTGPN